VGAKVSSVLKNKGYDVVSVAPPVTQDQILRRYNQRPRWIAMLTAARVEEPTIMRMLGGNAANQYHPIAERQRAFLICKASAD
jgi:hypothetical protein